ncbi:MAG: c-type cytochrome, partial [Burkholderiales bacterium]|nr:c-type cytochrome [Burkholderiales bacterium]
MKGNVINGRGPTILASLLMVLAGLPSVAGSQATLEPIEAWLASADLAAGKNVFLQCTACHVAIPGAAATIGPNLWNVVGRVIASESSYDYSESLRKVGGNWSFERLNV